MSHPYKYIPGMYIFSLIFQNNSGYRLRILTMETITASDVVL